VPTNLRIPDNFPRPVAQSARKPRTYQLDGGVIAGVSALADELQVWPSTVVNALLARGLDEVRRGRWRLGAEPAAYVAVWLDDGEGE